ncbi:MAG TPA: DsbA family oxidoreductase [Solirubrobacteraceae bacterium]|nr:DsbA family oxidoreductase [Solirubrobacteraceae bacterium]
MRVEIWSDIACPWCYVGKRRFEAALERFEQRDAVQVTYRSFELDPQAPRVREGDHTDHVAAKYGTTREHAASMHAQMREMAAAEGLELRFDRVRGGNTFDAHRLVHLGAAHGAQGEMKERLMRAYFAEGEPVGDPEALARAAADVVPEDAVREVLASDRYADAVREDERAAASLGIGAVPFYVVDRRIAVSGAQRPDVFVALLERALEPVGEGAA